MDVRIELVINQIPRLRAFEPGRLQMPFGLSLEHGLIRRRAGELLDEHIAGDTVWRPKLAL